MCQYIQKTKRKKENRTDKRKKERTKYFEYYYTPSDKYILYVIIKSIQACAIPFFSLYMRLGGVASVGLSFLYVTSCSTRAAGKKEEKEEKKKAKKLRDAMRCIYRTEREREKGGERFFFLLLNRKKSRARERGCKGREREKKEAAARRVH
jgi:hypothetical protein